MNRGYPVGAFHIGFHEGLGNPNLGGDGDAQLDVTADRIEWSCG